MEQQHARHLLSFVNQKQNIEDIKYYVAVRVAEIYKQLEGADLSQVTVLQGQLRELRKLETIDAYVKSKAV